MRNKQSTHQVFVVEWSWNYFNIVCGMFAAIFGIGQVGMLDFSRRLYMDDDEDKKNSTVWFFLSKISWSFWFFLFSSFLWLSICSWFEYFCVSQNYSGLQYIWLNENGLLNIQPTRLAYSVNLHKDVLPTQKFRKIIPLKVYCKSRQTEKA